MVSQKQMASKKATNSGRTPKIPYWKIFKQTSPQLFNVFFIFFVTLSIFPAVHSDVKKSSSSFFISDKYYVSVLCFLTFNVTAMIGASLSSLYAWVSILLSGYRPGPTLLSFSDLIINWCIHRTAN
jgi:Nucleoside transporter.